MTPKLLIEVSGTETYFFGPRDPGLLLPKNFSNVQVVDVGTGYTYRGRPYDFENNKAPQIRGTVSYVTGAHVAKFGAAYEWGGATSRRRIRGVRTT